jgi:hypothetical protein
MHIEQGYIALARITAESEIFQEKPHSWFKIWCYLLMRANHKNNEHHKRGNSWVKYSVIMESTGATKGQVYGCVKWLKKRGSIIARKSTRGFHFTIVNYEKYQNPNNYKKDTGVTEKRYGRDTINNNVNNEKNEINKKRQNYKSNMGSTTDEDGRPTFNKNGKKCIKGSDSGTYEV